MLKGFRQFVTEDTVSYHDAPSQSSTDTHTQEYTPLPQPQFNSPVAGKLHDLVRSMNKIDPFFNKRRNANVSGSIDFMSPEMAKGNSKHDDDSLTHFYISTSKTHPEVAMYMRPVVSLFKQFHNSILIATNDAYENNHFENIELSRRIDVRNVAEVKSTIEDVHHSLSQFNAADVRKLGTNFAQAIQHFNRFYNAFANVIPHVERHLIDAHNKVKHLAWDRTRYN